MAATPSLLANWTAVLTTQNLPAGARMDPVSRVLLVIRASVFPMTLVSGLAGGLLALRAHQLGLAREADPVCFALAVLGLVVAHAANNMINDWFDVVGGVATAGIPWAAWVAEALEQVLTGAGVARA